jgi:hypothetical protein
MKLSPALILALFTAACGSYTPKAPKPITVYLTDINKELKGTPWIDNYHALPELTADQQAHKMAERNRLVGEVVISMKKDYETFKVKLSAGKATEDTVGDILQIGLGGAGVLSAAERVKTVLATAATMLSGTKSSIDANWLHQHSISSLISEMDYLRDTEYAVILQKENQPVSAYSLEAAMSDLMDYYSAGTIVAAQQAIDNTTSSQAAAAKAALRH